MSGVKRLLAYILASVAIGCVWMLLLNIAFETELSELLIWGFFIPGIVASMISLTLLFTHLEGR